MLAWEISAYETLWTRFTTVKRMAEIAGLSRSAFIDELARRKVSVSQETESELRS